MSKNVLIKEFENVFHHSCTNLINTGGRFEICGNHTDHNHGLCLVANCSLRVRASIAKHETMVRVQSKGYKFFEFPIDNLQEKVEERGSTLAIAKGILFKLHELGYKIGGFEAYIESEIPDGSGVSSSAAMESLFGYIISYLYNDGKISEIDIAKTGQFSENVYFHKPCGLLDQIGTSFNSCNSIDFKNIAEPVINTVEFNLPVQLYLIKSEGNHSNLTPLYKAIPDSMYEVANLLEGKNFLRDVNDENIHARIDALDIDRKKKNKAHHFFNENLTVLKAMKAIKESNLELFFEAIRDSQESSMNNLENTFVEGEYVDSPQNIIDDVNAFIGTNGAIRIHGGGFKGTVLAFIKKDFCEKFEEFLASKYDASRYFKVSISSKAVEFERL